jgi:PRTRC genetic system protein A
MNPLDNALQGACPCVMVPRYEPLTLLAEDSHRFLIAGSGLFVECRRPWIHATLKVVGSPIPLPYGEPPSLFEIKLHRPALVSGLQHFIRRAREASPLEHAAWMTYDSVQGAMGYVEPEVISRGAAHIQYHRPDVTATSLPVVDCHSHGVLPAYFSDVDERDDRTDDAKLAFVVGNLDLPTPSVAMRFVGFGLSIDLSEWIASIFHTEATQTNANAENENDTDPAD